MLVCIVMLLLGMDVLKWVWGAYWTVIQGYNALLIIEPAIFYLFECLFVVSCMIIIIIFVIKYKEVN